MLGGAGESGSRSHLFEAGAMKRGLQPDWWASGQLQIPAQCLGGLEVWMDVRWALEERRDPRCHSHIKFCRRVGRWLKIRTVQNNAVDWMVSTPVADLPFNCKRNRGRDAPVLLIARVGTVIEWGRVADSRRQINKLKFCIKQPWRIQWQNL